MRSWHELAKARWHLREVVAKRSGDVFRGGWFSTDGVDTSRRERWITGVFCC
ncbi:hypothetical protein RISK_000505 [Rhodopirellula islandica]|uniref:Uncharacterized protein n=1 Tax=Rhodopirellula islandica TaxID=595434 RepID=A0A0J1BLR9_RHOIS|nr:hypothetical protein RISK_000505 [Rhodopirellula islandica]